MAERNPTRNELWYPYAGTNKGFGSAGEKPKRENGFKGVDKARQKVIANTTSAMGQFLERKVYLQAWAGQSLDPAVRKHLELNLAGVVDQVSAQYANDRSSEDLFEFWRDLTKVWREDEHGNPIGPMPENEKNVGLLQCVDSLYSLDLFPRFKNGRTGAYPGVVTRYIVEAAVIAATETLEPSHNGHENHILLPNVRISTPDERSSFICQFDAVELSRKPIRKLQRAMREYKRHGFWGLIETGIPWVKINLKSIFGTEYTTGGGNSLSTPRPDDMVRFLDKLGNAVVYWRQNGGKGAFNFPRAFQLEYIMPFRPKVICRVVLGVPFLSTWLSHVEVMMSGPHIDDQLKARLAILVGELESTVTRMESGLKSVDYTLPDSLIQRDLITASPNGSDVTTNSDLQDWLADRKPQKRKKPSTKNTGTYLMLGFQSEEDARENTLLVEFEGDSKDLFRSLIKSLYEVVEPEIAFQEILVDWDVLAHTPLVVDLMYNLNHSGRLDGLGPLKLTFSSISQEGGYLKAEVDLRDLLGQMYTQIRDFLVQNHPYEYEGMTTEVETIAILSRIFAGRKFTLFLGQPYEGTKVHPVQGLEVDERATSF